MTVTKGYKNLEGDLALSALEARLECLSAGNDILGSSHFDLVTEQSDIIVGQLSLEEEWG